MKYLNVNEILDIIDNQFGYDFEGKEKDDHLISSKTWTSYVGEFLDEKADNGDIGDYQNKIASKKRYREYREDFVKEVINFRKNQLIKQFNSNRKTTIDHEAIKVFKTVASALGMKVEESINGKRIPITKYKKKQEERQPAWTEEDVKKARKAILRKVIDQLIDMEKLNHDVDQHLISGSLDYGFADPLEMIEDKDGYPLGFSIDAKNYLKESVRLGEH